MPDLDANTDPLSARGNELSAVRPDRYATLVVGMHATPADPTVLSLTPAELFAIPIKSYEYALFGVAAVLIYHDALDAAHRIVQLEPDELRVRAKASRGISDRLQQAQGSGTVQSAATDDELAATSAYLHAIIHRREGDFSNSRYWYRRCANHPILPTLGRQVEEIARSEPADKKIFRITADGFNPIVFVEFVENLIPTDTSRHRFATIAQRLELQAMLAFCARAARG